MSQHTEGYRKQNSLPKFECSASYPEMLPPKDHLQNHSDAHPKGPTSPIQFRQILIDDWNNIDQMLS